MTLGDFLVWLLNGIGAGLIVVFGAALALAPIWLPFLRRVGR